MEHARSGGGGAGGSRSPRDHHHRYHGHHSRMNRLSSSQRERMESIFKRCSNPDLKQRIQLSRELHLQPRQVKFWFQNRRTQVKSRHEREDNLILQAENDRMRSENTAMKEALNNCICPNCGPPPLNEDSYSVDQKMRAENFHLKQQFDEVSYTVSKYTGKQLSLVPSVPSISITPTDMSMGISTFGMQQGLLEFGVGSGGASGIRSSLDLNLRQEASSSSFNSMPKLPQPGSFSEMDKPLTLMIATNAFEEFMRLLNTNEPLWVKSAIDGRDALNFETYDIMFPKENTRLRNPNVRVEASRDSAFVMMNSLSLVEMFIDPNKWKELFSTIVSAARTIEVISSGIMGGRNGSLQLMYEELQVLSPHVSAREFYFLRYSQQIEQGTWAIVDVSYDFPLDNQFVPQSHSRRFPSGCLIQDMPNGQSKVTWIEHVEIEDKTPPHRIFKNLIYSGMAFGAEKWLATLERMCERITCPMVTTNPTRDLGGVITTPEGNRSIRKLAQRMNTVFCATVGTSNGQKWTTMSRLNEIRNRVTACKITDPSQPNDVILTAATTIWLPIPPHIVFNLFMDESRRPQWDVLFNGNSLQEVAHIANGFHMGNRISILQAFNTTQNDMVILQESSIDSSGALVVYCPVDLPSIKIAINGGDPSSIPLIPSGFFISSDGQHHQGGGHEASNRSNTSRSIGSSGGSLITIAFQILVHNMPSENINMDSVARVNNFIDTTIEQIKASLNCPSSS